MSRGRKMTLKIYLRDQARRLSGADDNRLNSFARCISDGDHFRAEPYVYLYALTYESINSFLLLLNSRQRDEFSRLHTEFQNYHDLHGFMEGRNDDIGKIYELYRAFTRKGDADSPLKRSYKKGIDRLMNSKNITLYELSKRTGLNYGNLYRFTEKNRFDCISIEGCRKIVDYLEAC